MKHWLPLLALLCLPALAGAAIVDGIAAVVDRYVITTSEVDELAALGDRVADGSAGKTRALEILIEKHLVEREADRLGVRVTPEEVERAVEDVRKRNNLGPDAFRAAIESQGLTYEAYLEEIASQIRRAKLASRVLRSRVRVSDEALREYYLKNVAEYRVADGVRLQHLPLPGAKGRAAAEAARARAGAGEDFGALVRELSPGTADGGDMGWLAPESLSAEVKAAVFGLAEGAVSPVVEMRGGFHLFRVAERRKGRVQAFEEVLDRLKDRYFQDQEEELYQGWIQSLKDSARIDRRL